MAEFDLNRFLVAQERDYATALAEMKNGAKLSHWIWYIFPQQKGLGHSYNSWYYGLCGVEEAMAYWNHPVLKARLLEITNAVLSHAGKRDIFQIMGSGIDVKKFRSCMDLFDKVAPNDVFHKAIVTFYPFWHKNDGITYSRCGQKFVTLYDFLCALKSGTKNGTNSKF